MDKKCGVVVMLSHLKENEEVTFSQKIILVIMLFQCCRSLVLSTGPMKDVHVLESIQ